MSDLNMTVAALSDVGVKRTNNEDAWTIADLATGEELTQSGAALCIELDQRPMLLAVSDGMGGHAAGEVASALVLESLRDAMKGEVAGDSDGPMFVRIDAAVRRANRVVQDTAIAQSKHGMGATLTAAFVDGNEALVATVGDSRAYVLRNGQLKQVTRDQSFVQVLIDTGVMTPEAALTSPNRSVILQAMGQANDVRVAIGRLQLRRLDKLLICSDGISNAVSDPELAEILASSTPEDACKRMIELANARGGKDNQTAVVAYFGGEALALPLQSETVSSTMEAIQEFRPADAFREPAEPAPPPAPSPPPAPAATDSKVTRGARKYWVLAAATALVIAGCWLLKCRCG